MNDNRLGVLPMLSMINAFLEKWLPILTPASVVFGILASDYLYSFIFLIPWIFACMTFSGSLHANFKSLQHSITHPIPILISLIILHVLTPIWAWIIGHLFFNSEPLIITGFILAVVIPTGITSIIWVSMYKGNISATLSIILIDTFLSPLVVPFSVCFFVGRSVNLNVSELMQGLLFMIVLPTILAMIVNQYSSLSFTERLSKYLNPLAKLSLPFIIAINSSAMAPFIETMDLKYLSIAGTILVISVGGYLLCWLLGNLFRQKIGDSIAVIFTGGMRNITVGVVIAVGYFSPEVAIPVIMGMLFQQTLAAVNGYFIANRVGEAGRP